MNRHKTRPTLDELKHTPPPPSQSHPSINSTHSQLLEPSPTSPTHRTTTINPTTTRPALQLQRSHSYRTHRRGLDAPCPEAAVEDPTAIPPGKSPTLARVL
jgi:hypothetical protein